MFRLFKDVLAAAKEGLDEARAETRAGQEASAQETRDRTEQLWAEVASTPAELVFTVALGAAYRNVFLVELGLAALDPRPPVHLYVVRLPEGEVKAVRRFLSRDFDVVDEPSTLAALASLGAALARPDPDVVAVAVSRACWVTVAAEGLGLVAPGSALALAAPFGAAARARFGDWAAFGNSFLAGERHAPGSNPVGRQSLGRSVDALLSAPDSPWVRVRWPVRDA